MSYLKTTVTAVQTADFTPNAAASIYLIDAGGGDLTVTLGAAADETNAVYELIRIDASGHTVTVRARVDAAPRVPIADTIAGGAAILLPAGGARAIVSDNARAWYVLGGVNDQAGSGGVPDPLALGTNTFSDPATAGQHLAVYGGADDAAPAAVFGSDDPAYGQDAVQGVSGAGAGLHGASATGIGVYGTSDAGSGGDFSSSTGAGVQGLSTSGPGASVQSGDGPGLQSLSFNALAGSFTALNGPTAIQANKDIEVTGGTSGLVLWDRVTATRYRLYLASGAILIEEAPPPE